MAILTEGHGMPHRTEVERALAAWRDAERRAGRVRPGSPEHRLLLARIEELRLEYQRVLGSSIAEMDQLGAAARESHAQLSSSIEAATRARKVLRDTPQAGDHGPPDGAATFPFDADD